MKNSLYDLHVATDTPEGDEARGRRDALHASLKAMGITDDELVTHGITCNDQTSIHYEACPLIDIHGSVKASTRRELTKIETGVRTAMEQAGLPGYWHSELVAADVTAGGEGPWNNAEFFTDPIEARPRTDAIKEWDIHVAMRRAGVPSELNGTLIEHGLYYISRWKTRDGIREPWAIYTLQGINDVHEGKRFFHELVQWLILGGAPRFDAKLEVTTAMETYNNPRAVPPVTDSIVYTVA